MTNTEIRDLLVKRGAELVAQPRKLTAFSGIREVDELLNNIESYPHAYVLACLMDRQMKAERCWAIPYRFKVKLGTFAFERLAKLSQEDVLDLMINPEPLHRFSKTMADVFYCGVQDIKEKYDGDASNIWNGNPSSATLVKRFLEFKGAGPKIATMAANILVRDFKIKVSDKYSIDVSADVQVGRTFERLGLIRQGASTDEIIYTARELNPEYPGVVDMAAWEIGRSWCKPSNMVCDECYMNEVCPTGGEGLEIPK